MIGNLLLAAACVCGLDHEVSNEKCEVLWSGEAVKAERISRALDLDGFRSRILYVTGDLGFYAEVDSGDGVWTKTGLKKRTPGVYDLKYLTGTKFRLVAERDATNAVAVVNLANPGPAPAKNADAALTRGGPWSAASVKAHEPSDPFPIHGFDVKFLTVSSDNDAKITVELDLTGTGVWFPFRTFTAADRNRVNVSNLRAFRLRAVADRDCTATVQLEYR